MSEKNIPFLLIYRIMLQMQISAKQKKKKERKPAMFQCSHIFPDIRMNWLVLLIDPNSFY